MENRLVKCKYCSARLNPKNVSRHLRKVHNENNLSADVEKPKEEICPVCCGDGWVKGGCFKCEGSGWVSSYEKSGYRIGSDRPIRNDMTRIANANVIGNNLGAHYRDRDGRIGSNPEHDDYSDEGSA